MSAFLGIVRYEYVMAIRRWGVWIAFVIAAAFSLSSAGGAEVSKVIAEHTAGGMTLALAGMIALMMNTLTPMVGGIAMADRLSRDYRLGVAELMRSAPVTRRCYIVGKYVGVVLSVLTPALLVSIATSLVMLVLGAPTSILWDGLKAFVGINVPAYLFVAAFAIACPAVLPVRVFQVLFIGYWVWGNFVSPSVMPTLAGTLLTPSGRYVRSAFFGTDGMWMGEASTPTEAVLNLVVLAACAAAALIVLDRYLAWQERRV